MKFNEMPYKRIETSEVINTYDEIISTVLNAKCICEIVDSIKKHEETMSHYQTMESIAYVRNSVNTEDEFYSAEREFYDNEIPLIQEKLQLFSLALYNSKFRPQLEEKYGTLLFKNIEMEIKCFTPDIIPMLQEENHLVSEYQKMIASAQIDFEGETLNISQLSSYKENSNREIRKAAYFAEGNFYNSHSLELDRIFDELVKCRTKIAQSLGFKSFTEVAYLRRTRNCYDPKMVENFREQVKNNIVPIVKRLKKLQSQRIEIDEMKFYDDLFGYSEGNPKPIGNPDNILASGKRMYEEMSPDTKEFINFMYDNELLDVASKKGKAVGGYCTSFPDYKSPFIFSNFNGTSGDVDVLTHEAGHAFAGYMSKDFELMETSQPTMESCEVHSMSMEFMAWNWLNLFYGDDTTRAKFMHLESALIFIPYGCMVDEFQHIIYDNPDFNANERHTVWAKLEATYRPYLDFADVPFYNEGKGWQRQLHIYHYPFYYIDYCLAQTVALEFWSLSQVSYESAWNRYIAFVKEGGTKTFVDLCKVADVKNPFESGSLERIASTAEQWLNR